MQSIWQYKRIGKHVQSQLERDKQKYNLIRAINQGDPVAFAQQHRQSAAPEVLVDEERGDVDHEKPSDEPDSPLEEREPVEEKDHAYRNSTSDSSHEEQSQKPERSNSANLDTTLSRTTTRSNRSLGTKIGHALTGVDVRNRTAKEGGDRSRQVFVVGFEGDKDPLNPHSWGWARRLAATAIIALIAGIVGIASSIDSSALKPAAAEFGVSEVTESLATGKS